MSQSPQSAYSPVMFADISRSTSLYEKLGDEAAAQLVLQTLQFASEVARRHHGTVVKSKGDDILCTFQSAQDAVEAALDLHASSRLAGFLAQHQVAFRVGINLGNYVASQGDIYGDAVNVAARLAATAKAHQTVVSSAVKEACPEAFGGTFRVLGEVSVRGKGGLHEIFEVLKPDQTAEITEVVTADRMVDRATQLRLLFNNRETRLTPFTVRHLLGRGPECDMVLNHPTVSREHAEIRYRNGRFVLTDFSTNGTWVHAQGGPYRLHRSSRELRGNGIITLGAVSRGPLAVQYYEEG